MIGGSRGQCLAIRMVCLAGLQVDYRTMVFHVRRLQTKDVFELLGTRNPFSLLQDGEQLTVDDEE